MNTFTSVPGAGFPLIILSLSCFSVDESARQDFPHKFRKNDGMKQTFSWMWYHKCVLASQINGNPSFCSGFFRWTTSKPLGGGEYIPNGWILRIKGQWYQRRLCVNTSMNNVSVLIEAFIASSNDDHVIWRTQLLSHFHLRHCSQMITFCRLSDSR